jgi:hypothetical protein
MKSTPLVIHWHEQNAPVYSAHFEPHGKGRLATSGGDNNVRVGGAPIVPVFVKARVNGLYSCGKLREMVRTERLSTYRR